MAPVKLATFERGGTIGAGVILDPDRILDLAVAMAGSPAGEAARGGILSLLEAGDDALNAVRTVAAHPPSSAVVPLNEVTLKAPILYPRKLFCLAGNYAEHIREGGQDVTEKDRVTPRVFMKPPTTTVIGPHDAIRIPPVGQKIDWEAELAVIIGRRGKAIPLSEALSHVAGYTVMNDVSERGLKIRERDQSSEWDRFFDWLNGKWLDTFAPMGPWMVTADEIPDPQRLSISLWVNAQQMQQGNTGQMIFSVADLVHYISQIITLEPGDVIATGTPAGVGMGRGIFLKPGDRVRIEIERVGVLENPVVAG